MTWFWVLLLGISVFSSGSAQLRNDLTMHVTCQSERGHLNHYYHFFINCLVPTMLFHRDHSKKKIILCETFIGNFTDTLRSVMPSIRFKDTCGPNKKILKGFDGNFGQDILKLRYRDRKYIIGHFLSMLPAELKPLVNVPIDILLIGRMHPRQLSPEASVLLPPAVRSQTPRTPMANNPQTPFTSLPPLRLRTTTPSLPGQAKAAISTSTPQSQSAVATGPLQASRLPLATGILPVSEASPKITSPQVIVSAASQASSLVKQMQPVGQKQSSIPINLSANIEASESASRQLLLTKGHVSTSGAQRRSISNFNELAEALSQSFGASSVQKAFLEVLDIHQQFLLFHRARVIVAQHGAGLANVFFSRDQLTLGVIEISPYDANRRKGKYTNSFPDCFKSIAQYLNLSYVRIKQEDEFGEANITEVVRSVGQLLRPSVFSSGPTVAVEP